MKNKTLNNLTGMRGLAAVFVLLYHLNTNLFSGAFIAVDIFFLLSGFLTIYHFNIELENNGRINYLKYYKKRITRIYPNLLFMCFSVYAIYSIIAPYQLLEMKDTIIASLLGVVNYQYVFSNVDYFAQNTVVNPFGHLWALAIEMQFYVFIPFVYALLINNAKNGKPVNFDKPRNTNKILLIYVVAILIMPISYFITAGNTTIAYYDTFNRLAPLMLGALFAWNYSKQVMNREYLSAKLFYDTVSILITILLFAAAFVLSGTQIFLYKYGFFVLDLLLAIYMIILTSDYNILSPFFNSRLLKYLGTRSYGIFLWHLPLIAIFQYKSSLILDLFIVVLTFIMAEVTYQLFDCGILFTRNRKYKPLFVSLGLGLVIFTIFEFTIFIKNPEQFTTITQEEYVLFAKDLDYLNLELTRFNTEFSNPEQILENSISEFESYVDTIKSLPNYTNIVIGDSVMSQLVKSIDSQVFEKQNNYQDVKIGMQSDELLERMQKYAFLDSEKTNIIFNVGNNGPIKYRELAQMVELYPQSNVYILQLISKQEWTASSAKEIEKVANEYDNVHLVAVDELVNEDEDLLLPDQLHYTDQTISKVKLLIVDTMRKTL